MKIKVFSVSKYEKNEDKWHIPYRAQAAGDEAFDETRPVTLCDGASESYNSSLWAEILCKSLQNQADFSDEWLKERIGEYEREINPQNLGWSRQMAYERGSFATFLSVFFQHGKCLVNAVGDSVAVVVNGADGSVLESFPYDDPGKFLEHPLLLSTKPELNTQISGDFQSEFVCLDKATHVLLLTDALGHWLMKRKKEPESVRRLLAIADAAEFAEFVLKERQNDLRFDDTTMIRISLVDNLPVLPVNLQAAGEE